MNEKCSNCSTFYSRGNRVITFSERSTVFLEFYNGVAVALSLPSDVPTTLENLLPDSMIFNKDFCDIVRSYNNFVAMSCVKASWTSTKSRTFTINPTMTPYRHGYLYRRAIAHSPLNLSPLFLSVYIYDTDYELQVSIRPVEVTSSRPHISQLLIVMLHGYSPYMQSFASKEAIGVAHVFSLFPALLYRRPRNSKATKIFGHNYT